MSLLKKCVIGSLIAHLLIIVLSGIISWQNDHIKRTLVVFGAHSRKASSVRYKGNRNAPFANPHGKKTEKTDTTTKRSEKQPHKKNIRSKARRKPVTQSKKQAKKSALKQARTKKESCKQKNEHKNTHQQAAPSTPASIQESGSAIKAASKKNTIKTPSYKEPLEGHEKRASARPKKQALQSAPVENTIQEDINLPDDKQPDDADNITEESQGLIDKQDFNIIGSYKSEELLVYHKHVQTEVDRLWRPPVGVPRGTVCTIEFTVDTQGFVSARPTDRSSVLIYDLSIINIAHNFQFHRSLWGKTFKISFRQ